MRRYKIVYVDMYSGGQSLVDSLDGGWKIERADSVSDFIIYILYKEAR